MPTAGLYDGSYYILACHMLLLIDYGNGPNIQFEGYGEHARLSSIAIFASCHHHVSENISVVIQLTSTSNSFSTPRIKIDKDIDKANKQHYTEKEKEKKKK